MSSSNEEIPNTITNGADIGIGPQAHTTKSEKVFTSLVNHGENQGAVDKLKSKSTHLDPQKEATRKSIDTNIHTSPIPTKMTASDTSTKSWRVEGQRLAQEPIGGSKMNFPVNAKKDNDTLQSGGLAGPMSPTSSSSVSSQGSTTTTITATTTTVGVGGTATTISATTTKKFQPKHGFSVNHELHTKTLPLQHHQKQQLSMSNVKNIGPSENASSVVVKEIPTKQERVTSTTTSNNISHGGERSRSNSTQSRPRSNSVPFDFQSTNRSTKSTSPNKSGQLRRGKWTVEEEAYVARVIQDFNSGYLNAPPGTTLRTYLSDKLNCDPMRITKKFTGDACIGKRVFHPAVRCSNNAALIDKAQTELDALERRWRKRLEMQQREVAKKQAASAAAAAAAVSGRMGKAIHSSLGNNGSRAVVAQTASWLDRANAILSHAHAPTRSEQKSEIVKTNSDEVEKEMKEVERLIHEGPIIQKTSAGLPKLLGNTVTANVSTSQISSRDAPTKRKVSDDTLSTRVPQVTTNPQSYQQVSSTDEMSHFHDKRLRKSFSHNNIQDHEDAATLMGFLSSVRQAAASSASSSK